MNKKKNNGLNIANEGYTRGMIKNGSNKPTPETAVRPSKPPPAPKPKEK